MVLIKKTLLNETVARVDECIKKGHNSLSLT